MFTLYQKSWNSYATCLHEFYLTEFYLNLTYRLNTILSEFLLNLRCLLCFVFYIIMVSSLMNVLVWDSFSEISINVNKLFIVYFIYVRSYSVVVACLFVYPIFYTALYCCLFIYSSSYFLFFLFLRKWNI